MLVLSKTMVAPTWLSCTVQSAYSLFCAEEVFVECASVLEVGAACGTIADDVTVTFGALPCRDTDCPVLRASVSYARWIAPCRFERSACCAWHE